MPKPDQIGRRWLRFSGRSRPRYCGWNSAGELYLLWNELRVQGPDTSNHGTAYESQVYYAAVNGGAPVSGSLVSDHLGLGSVYDGRELVAAAGPTGTVHIAWSAVHPPDIVAGASNVGSVCQSSATAELIRP